MSNRGYTYGLERISQRLTANGQKLSFYGYDGHGSVRFLMDSTGVAESEAISEELDAATAQVEFAAKKAITL